MRSLAVVALLAASCQTRTQATVVALGTGAIALGGGYYEHASGAPPLTAYSAGAIALISAVSMLFLDDHARTLFDHTPRGSEPAPRHGTSALLAGLQRTGLLLGPCPVYSVAVYRDGFVQYVGRANVATLGEATDHLAPARVTALEQRLDRAHVLGFDDTYLDVDATSRPDGLRLVSIAGGGDQVDRALPRRCERTRRAREHRDSDRRCGRHRPLDRQATAALRSGRGIRAIDV